jgi:hypothetical protein
MDGGTRRGGLVGPMILIGLGIVFLLNNLGYLPWSVWPTLLRLWPVLLVAAGLDLLIGRRSVWGSLLAGLLVLAVLLGSLWLLHTETDWRAAQQQEVRQALDGATRAEVILTPAVGSVRLEPLTGSGNLIEGTVQLGRGERLVREYALGDGTAVFRLGSEGAFVGPAGWGAASLWDLGLSPEVPLRLEVHLGAGDFDFDLTGLTLEELETNLGVGRTVVVLPGTGVYSAAIDGAIGETVVVVPAGLGLRVHLDTGLVGTQLPDGLDCAEDVCTSPGYFSAAHRVDLRVSHAIGSVVIRHP